MSTQFSKSVAAMVRLTVPLAAAFVLTGCQDIFQDDFDQSYKPATHYQRYPIEVAKGNVKINIPTKSARMSAAQEDAVTRFAQSAVTSGATNIVVRRPANQVNSDVIAGRVTQILSQQGLASSAVRHATYKGGRGAPVQMSYSRKFAVTKECGDYSKSSTVTGLNDQMPDFGCAHQNNLAAMVANPQDLITPRTMTPGDAERRGKVLEAYRKPTNPATPQGDNVVTVSNQ